jgi:hypothetical protein
MGVVARRSWLRRIPAKAAGKDPVVVRRRARRHRNPEQVKAFWKGSPDANIGVSYFMSGHCIVDIDVKEQVNGFKTRDALAAEGKILPETLTLRTRNGGFHYVYQDPDGCVTSKAGVWPGIDTRGDTGYGAGPGSVVPNDRDGALTMYTVALDAPIALLPDWIRGHFGQTAKERQERIRKSAAAIGNDEWDRPLSIEYAEEAIERELAEHGGPPVMGQGSDGRCIEICQKLLDYALTDDVVLDLLKAEWQPGFDLWWYKEKLGNAHRYRQNDIGCDRPKGASERFPSSEEEIAAAKAARAEHRGRFAGFWPDELENRPAIDFWDDDKTLPKIPDGAIGLLSAGYGEHKTNVVLMRVLDAVGRGARVLYAAGEGSYGVGRDRVPAHCRARGITTASLRGKLKIVPAVPLFASSQEVQAFIDANRDFNPHIVVIDTLATAIAGQDENSAMASAFLTDNGPAGQIKRAFNALVILPAHLGKDKDRGTRGHSGFAGNVDFELVQEADDCGAIKQHVRKMRDGADGFDVYFRVPRKPCFEVPVPVRITEREYKDLIATAGGSVDVVFAMRRGILNANRVHNFLDGWTHRKFAEELVNVTNGVTPATRATAIEKEAKSLENACRAKKYQDVIAWQEVPAGSATRRLEWRWYVPREFETLRGGSS